MARVIAQKTGRDLNINYVAYPTSQEFHASTAFIRVLLGPVGCYDADTEYLAPTGWRRIADYDGGQVAQWDKDTGTASFVVPDQYVVEPCDTMWRFHNLHSLDMMVSDEHRMPLYQFDGQFVVKTAAQVAAKPSRYTVPTTFTPATPGIALTDAQLRVQVMVHADGHLSGNKCIIRVHKKRKALRVVQLLEAAGIAYTRDERLRADRGSWVYHFSFIPPERTKTFAGWWAASPHQLHVIIDEVQYWDGLFEGKDRRYYTTVKEDADFIQYAVHACGGRASISMDDYSRRNDRVCTDWKPGYMVHIAFDNAKAKVMLRGDTAIVERVPTVDGKKYCFTVPASFLVMRRSGRIFVSGNSGKSSATWLELFRRACEEWPDSNGVRSSMHLCVRDTYAMLKETTIQDFLSWFGPVANVVYDSPIRANVTMPLRDGTTLDWNLRFLSMDGGEKSLNALRGMQIGAAYLNEGHSLVKDIWDVTISRIGRYRPAGKSPKWCGLISDSNFGYQGCHLHNMYMNTAVTDDGKAINAEFFEQPPAAYWDARNGRFILNPHCDNLERLPGGIQYYQNILDTASVEYIKQFLANQWAVKQSGKQVYPEYSPQLHLIRGVIQPDRRLPLIVGMDFGLHAAATIEQLSPRGKLITLREVWNDDADLETFLDRDLLPVLRGEYAGFKSIVCGDPAGMGRSSLDKRNAFQVLQSRGLSAYPSVTNDPARRWGAVKYFLTRSDGYGVHHACKRMVEGYEGGYGFKKRADGSYSDDAEKNVYSHTHDAHQYAATFARFGPKHQIDPLTTMKNARAVEARARQQGIRPGQNNYFFA